MNKSETQVICMATNCRNNNIKVGFECNLKNITIDATGKCEDFCKEEAGLLLCNYCIHLQKDRETYILRKSMWCKEYDIARYYDRKTEIHRPEYCRNYYKIKLMHKM